MNKNYTNHINLLPYITIIQHANTQYIGIVQVKSKQFTSMFVLDLIDSDDQKRMLLQLGEQWWWQSNRNIPITLYMAEEMDEFLFCRKTFQTKDIEILAGPVVSISNLPTKRIKRRNTSLRLSKD